MLPPCRFRFRCYSVDSQEEEEVDNEHEEDDLAGLELCLSGCTDMAPLRSMVVRRARRKRLATALAALGCDLRSESRLRAFCKAYIEHGTGSPQRVAVTARVSWQGCVHSQGGNACHLVDAGQAALGLLAGRVMYNSCSNCSNCSVFACLSSS